VSGASLDLGKNNSTEPESADTAENRYDCRHVFQNFEYREQVPVDEEPATAQYRCNSWRCYCCGYRMRMNLVEEIERVALERPEMSRLLTLTLDPDTAPKHNEQQHHYITERWNALRTRLRREIGDFDFIWVREEQESGLPHLHILVSRYLPQRAVSAAWEQLGGGGVVDIRQIERVDKAAHYVGKYLTKDALTGMPKGIRRYGSSSSITLAVRGAESDAEPDHEWELVREAYESLAYCEQPLTTSVLPSDFSKQQNWGQPYPPPMDRPDGVHTQYDE
jgi:hypothetical protein